MDTIKVVPEFPLLTGPLGAVVETITQDIPYEFRALSVLAYVGLALSGRTAFAGDYRKLQPRLYVCLVGGPGVGKSAAVNEVHDVLRGTGRVQAEKSINSGPALVMALKERENPNNPSAVPRVIYLPDEASGAFAKAKAGGMFADFLHLFEHNDISNRVKERVTTVENAHFSMVATATPSIFSEMWQTGGGINGGLPSRFVLAFSDKCFPAVKTATDPDRVSGAVEMLQLAIETAPTEITLPEKKGDFTSGLLGDGSIDRSQHARVVDMGRRFCLILAACNSEQQISDQTMALGAAFIKYQLALYDKLMNPDALTYAKRFEDRIAKFFERHPGRHTERDIRNNIRPDLSLVGYGPYLAAINNLKRAGQMIESSTTTQKGKHFYSWDTDQPDSVQ